MTRRSGESNVLATTVDPDGRGIQLSRERWEHIIRGHPELKLHLAEVMDAVRRPDRRMPGRVPGEEWFYLANAGPSRWLKVVVHYQGDVGRIITAFARRSMP